MSADFEQPVSPAQDLESKLPLEIYSPVMTLPDNYSLFRGPASSFSSATTSGASFSSVDDGDAVGALPAISRDFAVPTRNDESRRPKTAGGLLQRGGWGGASAFSTIDETAPLPVFGDPFENQQQHALNLKSDSISPDPLVDPNASGRRASEPHFNFGQGLVSLPSHVQFLQANDLPPSNWSSPAQPSLNTLSLATGDGYNPHSYPAPPRAMSTADLRPQTSDGIPSYLSNAKIPPPPTFHLSGPDARRAHPSVGINGLPHTYHPPRSFSTNYQHPPPYPIASGSAPQRSASLDHSRFGLSSTPAASQAQDQAQNGGKSLPKKRPRRRFDEIERLYTCGFDGCEKAYGTLNHLNAHVTMQKHGEKRLPGEFKELRKAWRKKKREMASNGSGSHARGSDEFESSDDVVSRRESDVSTSQDQLNYFRAYAPSVSSNAWPGARPYDESSRPTSSSSVASSASSFGGYYTQPPSYLPHPPQHQRRVFAPSHVPIPAPPATFQPPPSDFATPTQQHPNRGGKLPLPNSKYASTACAERSVRNGRWSIGLTASPAIRFWVLGLLLFVIMSSCLRLLSLYS